MKVSVIVPVYNVEKYIEKCLNSLVNQTLSNIEIIVVNDGTKDNSQTIIDEFVKKYPDKVKSFIKENGGLSDARNYGIKYATGEYIGFVDSDDYVDVTMFEKMYNKAKREDLDIVVCDVKNCYEGNLEINLSSNHHYSEDEKRNYVIAPPMACTRLYKRNIFNKHFFKVGILYEDLEFNPSLVTKFKNIGFIEEPLYYYLQRQGSIMYQGEFNNKLLDIFKVLESVEDKFKQDDCYNEYYFEIEYLYITHLLRTGGLRFSEYKQGKNYIKKISHLFHTKYKNWRKNPYYKKSSFKLKIICNLTYHKLCLLLRLLNKINR